MWHENFSPLLVAVQAAAHLQPPLGGGQIISSAFLATLFSVVRPPDLALGGVQLPLPVLQWSEWTERT